MSALSGTDGSGLVSFLKRGPGSWLYTLAARSMVFWRADSRTWLVGLLRALGWEETGRVRTQKEDGRRVGGRGISREERVEGGPTGAAGRASIGAPSSRRQPKSHRDAEDAEGAEDTDDAEDAEEAEAEAEAEWYSLLALRLPSSPLHLLQPLLGGSSPRLRLALARRRALQLRPSLLQLGLQGGALLLGPRAEASLLRQLLALGLRVVRSCLPCLHL